jgi:signal transduction histidine kinase
VSAIRGYLESILNNPEMDQTMRENFLKRAYEQVERLGDLLADVSTLTRVSEAPQRVIREPLDLIPIIEEVLEEFPIQERQRMEVRLDLPSTLPLEGNIQLLRSIFHNLISNALSYSSGTELHIRLIDQHASGYHFELFDNGQGVEEHHLEHLFERFYRVDKGRSRKLGGTGLGLAIVKHSVLFHGGTIQVENRPEGGLHFRFMLARGGNG